MRGGLFTKKSATTITSPEHKIPNRNNCIPPLGLSLRS